MKILCRFLSGRRYWIETDHLVLLHEGMHPYYLSYNLYRTRRGRFVLLKRSRANYTLSEEVDEVSVRYILKHMLGETTAEGRAVLASLEQRRVKLT